MADQSPVSFRQTLRLLCIALMASLMVVLIAVVSILSQDGTGTPPVWAVATLVAVAGLEATLVAKFGYRFTPTAPGTDEDTARRDSVGQVRSSTILRFAISEAVGIVAIALAFIVNNGGLYLVIGGVAVAELLMFWHLWPSERLIARIQESLESEGGSSYLREALDAPPPGRS